MILIMYMCNQFDCEITLQYNKVIMGKNLKNACLNTL
jgi:phosphotransferase system HPr-like phosphotransfer protein